MPRSETPPGAGAFAAQVLLILGKDLRIEWRSREIISSMVFFAVLVVVVFSFAFAGEGIPARHIAAGALWIVIIFAGSLGLGRVFDREREEDTHQALLLCPVSPAAIYLAKLLGVLLHICAVEAVVVPLLALFFGLQIHAAGLLVGLLLAGSVGFSAVGSLLAAGLMQGRSRDVLLGSLIFPVVTPVIVAGAKGTAALLASPGAAAGALLWLKLMLAFDLVFVTISLWAFGPMVRGD